MSALFGDPSACIAAEEAGLNASAPPQQLWLDGWLVRLSPGKAKRARCVNAVAPGRRPLDERLDEMLALFREAGLPPIVRITPFTEPPSLDGRLAAMGWARFDDTRVMLLPDLAAAVAAAGQAAQGPAGLQAERAGPERYAQAVGALRGSPAEQVRAHAQRIALSPVPYAGRVWRDAAGQVVACGQCARQQRWVGLYDVFVAPSQRGRGVARALCASLLREALAEGAAHAYLQVESDNAPARAAYRRLGFADGYAYHYRSPDPSIA